MAVVKNWILVLPTARQQSIFHLFLRLLQISVISCEVILREGIFCRENTVFCWNFLVKWWHSVFRFLGFLTKRQITTVVYTGSSKGCKSCSFFVYGFSYESTVRRKGRYFLEWQIFWERETCKQTNKKENLFFTQGWNFLCICVTEYPTGISWAFIFGGIAKVTCYMNVYTLCHCEIEVNDQTAFLQYLQDWFNEKSLWLWSRLCFQLKQDFVLLTFSRNWTQIGQG